jgi:hypothetical protein
LVPAARISVTAVAPDTVTVPLALSVREPPSLSTCNCDSKRMLLSFRLPANVIRPFRAVNVRDRLSGAVIDAVKPIRPAWFAVSRATITSSAAEAKYSRVKFTPFDV